MDKQPPLIIQTSTHSTEGKFGRDRPASAASLCICSLCLGQITPMERPTERDPQAKKLFTILDCKFYKPSMNTYEHNLDVRVSEVQGWMI